MPKQPRNKKKTKKLNTGNNSRPAIKTQKELRAEARQEKKLQSNITKKQSHLNSLSESSSNAPKEKLTGNQKRQLKGLKRAERKTKKKEAKATINAEVQKKAQFQEEQQKLFNTIKAQANGQNFQIIKDPNNPEKIIGATIEGKQIKLDAIHGIAREQHKIQPGFQGVHENLDKTQKPVAKLLLGETRLELGTPETPKPGMKIDEMQTQKATLNALINQKKLAESVETQKLQEQQSKGTSTAHNNLNLDKFFEQHEPKPPEPINKDPVVVANLEKAVGPLIPPPSQEPPKGSNKNSGLTTNSQPRNSQVPSPVKASNLAKIDFSSIKAPSPGSANGSSGPPRPSQPTNASGQPVKQSQLPNTATEEMVKTETPTPTKNNTSAIPRSGNANATASRPANGTQSTVKEQLDGNGTAVNKRQQGTNASATPITANGIRTDGNASKGQQDISPNPPAANGTQSTVKEQLDGNGTAVNKRQQGTNASATPITANGIRTDGNASKGQQDISPNPPATNGTQSTVKEPGNGTGRQGNESLANGRTLTLATSNNGHKTGESSTNNNGPVSNKTKKLNLGHNNSSSNNNGLVPDKTKNLENGNKLGNSTSTNTNAQKLTLGNSNKLENSTSTNEPEPPGPKQPDPIPPEPEPEPDPDPEPDTGARSKQLPGLRPGPFQIVQNMTPNNNIEPLLKRSKQSSGKGSNLKEYLKLQRQRTNKKTEVRKKEKEIERLEIKKKKKAGFKFLRDVIGIDFKFDLIRKYFNFIPEQLGKSKLTIDEKIHILKEGIANLNEEIKYINKNVDNLPPHKKPADIERRKILQAMETAAVKEYKKMEKQQKILAANPYSEVMKRIMPKTM
jgi:hypothetical protein